MCVADSHALAVLSPCMQVSAEFAAVLQSFGFTVNSMGGETRLDLATYNFTGKPLCLTNACDLSNTRGLTQVL